MRIPRWTGFVVDLLRTGRRVVPGCGDGLCFRTTTEGPGNAERLARYLTD